MNSLTQYIYCRLTSVYKGHLTHTKLCTKKFKHRVFWPWDLKDWHDQYFFLASTLEDPTNNYAFLTHSRKHFLQYNTVSIRVWRLDLRRTTFNVFKYNAITIGMVWIIPISIILLSKPFKTKLILDVRPNADTVLKDFPE